MDDINITASNSTSEALHTGVPMVLVLAFLIVSIIVVTANITVLCVSIAIPTLRQKDHVCLVISLCISDTIVGMAGIIFGITYTTPSLYTNKEFCSFHLILFCSGMMLSLAQLLTVTFHMWLSTKKTSLTEFLFGNERKYIVVVTTCLFLEGISVLSRLLQEDTIEVCHMQTLYKKKHHMFVLGFLGWYGIISIGLIFLFSGMTIFRVRKLYSKTVPAPVYITETARNGKVTIVQETVTDPKFRQALKTVLILLTLVTLCVGPVVLVCFVEGFGVQVTRTLRSTLSALAILNSLANPCVYIYRYKELQVALLPSCCHKNN